MFCTLHIDKRKTIFILLAVIAGIVMGIAGVQVAQANKVVGKEKQGIKVPIIMYHSMLKEKNRQGKFVISPELFENDLQYLKQNGYTSINMRDLIDYINSNKPLPEKPIMLTFDDGYYNNYLYAYPLAKQYQFKIVISPIGYFTDKYSETNDNHPNYSHITWEQINEMMKSGYVEFQNHTYNLHSNNKGRMGAKKLPRESKEQYAQILSSDINKLQEEMKEKTGYTPTTFVYPFGAVSYAAMPVIKKLGFQASLTCAGKINVITKDPECLYDLGRYLRPTGISSGDYFCKKLKLNES